MSSLAFPYFRRKRQNPDKNRRVSRETTAVFLSFPNYFFLNLKTIRISIRYISCTTLYEGGERGRMTNEKFTQVVEQYERYVFTICYQLVRDYGEAQNLAQDAFLSAYQHIDGCDPASYKPWLARIAANKAKDFLKSAYQRRVQVGQDEKFEQIPIEQTPDDIYIAGEAEQYIKEKIKALREPYLKVSVLYFLEEKNVDEIAQLLNRPKKTVQTQIYRAKMILREQLKEERVT